MATIKTAQHGNNYCPQAQFEVTEKSSTGGATTYSWVLKWVTHGYTVSSSASKAYSAKIDGATVTSGNFAIGGKSTTTIASGEYTINKGTSARSVPISVSFAMTFTWSGTGGSTKTASGSVNLAAKTSYTVSYNANGGSGAPGSQTKWYGTNLTLASGKPSRTGHTFNGWATSASGSVAYQPGGTYSANAGVTLYAKWTAHTYTVSYNANGGSGAPGSQTKTYGVSLTLSSTKPTRTNYNFLGWSTSASGGVVYAAGATYTNNSAVTLYAVWQLAYKKPRVSNLTAYRCTSDGTASETGTYLRVKYNWATDRNQTCVNIDWKAQTASNWTVLSAGATQTTSGTVDKIIGGGSASIETSYYVRAYVEDSGGYTLTGSVSVGTVKFPIDVKSGGKGVAIGKVAEKNAFEVGMDTYFNRDTYMSKSVAEDVYYNAERSDTGTKVGFGVGSGGINHGIWSYKLNRWMIYGDASNAYFTGDVNGTATYSNRAKKLNSTSSGSDTAGTAGWYLVASKAMNGDWEDVSATLLITQQYERVNCGILRIKCRRNQESPYFQALTWITRHGWNRTDACGVVSGNTIKVYIYTNVGQYSRIGVTVLEDAYRGGNGSLTLHNSTAPTTGLSGTYTAGDSMTFHPVGTVVIMSSNTNPSNYYGGTWELIDKEFAPADNVSAWSHNTTNVSSSDHDFTRAGHSLFLSGGFTTKTQWEDSDIHLGTVNFSALGVSRIGSDAYFVAYTDDGNSGLMCEIEYDTGKLIVHDNFGDSYISAGRSGKWYCNITVPMAYMNDGACNKFYFKRTA